MTNYMMKRKNRKISETRQNKILDTHHITQHTEAHASKILLRCCKFCFKEILVTEIF